MKFFIFFLFIALPALAGNQPAPASLDCKHIYASIESRGLPSAMPGRPVLAQEFELGENKMELFAPFLAYRGKPLTSFSQEEYGKIIEKIKGEHKPVKWKTFADIWNGKRPRFNMNVEGLTFREEAEFIPAYSFGLHGKFYEAGVPAKVHFRELFETQLEWGVVAARDDLGAESSMIYHQARNGGWDKAAKKIADAALNASENPHRLFAKDPALFEVKVRSTQVEDPLEEMRIVFAYILKGHNGASVGSFTHHAHVAQVPGRLVSRLKGYGEAAPNIYATGMTAYHQLLEWERILNTGGTRYSAPHRFGYLTAERVPGVFDFFKGIQQTNGKVARDPIQNKFFNVGVRRISDDTFSFEHRLNSVAGGFRKDSEQSLASSMAMARDDYRSLPWDSISKFSREFGDASGEVMASLWKIGEHTSAYEKYLDKSANAALKREVLAKKFAPFANNADFADDSNLAYVQRAFILSHWDLHPFVRYSPELRQKVIQAQKNALDGLLKGEDSRGLAAVFWKESGLEATFQSEAGIKGLFGTLKTDYAVIAPAVKEVSQMAEMQVMYGIRNHVNSEEGLTAKGVLEALDSAHGIDKADADISDAYRLALLQRIKNSDAEDAIKQSVAFAEAEEIVQKNYRHSRFGQLGQNSPLAQVAKPATPADLAAAKRGGNYIMLKNFDQEIPAYVGSEEPAPGENFKAYFTLGDRNYVVEMRKR